MPKAHANRPPTHEDQPLAPVSGDTEAMSEGLPGGEAPQTATDEPETTPQEVAPAEPEREPAEPVEATTPPPSRRATSHAKPAAHRRPSGGTSRSS